MVSFQRENIIKNIFILEILQGKERRTVITFTAKKLVARNYYKIHMKLCTVVIFRNKLLLNLKKVIAVINYRKI